MAKKTRKFVGSLIALTLGASTLIAVSPAQAVVQATTASVTVPHGLRAGEYYNDELYVGRGYFNHTGVFVQGSITGPDKDETDLVSVQLDSVDLDNSSVDVDELDIYWADYYDSLFAYEDEDSDEYVVASDYYEDEDWYSVLFEEPGTYNFKLTFNNFDNDETFTKIASITVAGNPVSSTITENTDKLPVTTDDQYSYSGRTLKYYDDKGRETTLNYEDNFWINDSVDGDVDFDANGYEDWANYGYFLDENEYFTSEAGYPIDLYNWYGEDARLYVRTYIDNTDDEFDSNTVSLNTREWVSLDSLDESVSVKSTDGVVVAEACNFTTCDNDYNSVWIRESLDSITLEYNGGADNADKFVELYLYDNWGLAVSDETELLLTDSTGHAEVTYDLSSVDVDDYVYAEAKSYDYSNYDYSDSFFIESVESGSYPRYNLQDVSNYSETIWEDHGVPYFSDQFSKSVTPGSEMSLTFKAVDIFGDPIVGLRTEIGTDCAWINFCGDYSIDDNDKFTNSNGLVTFNVTNDVTMDDLDYLDETCGENANNCQEDNSSTWAHMERRFYAETYYDGWSTSDLLLTSVVRSTSVADVGLWTSAWYTDGPIDIDTLGDTSEDNIQISVTPTNVDGVELFGVSASIEASDGAYVYAHGACAWWGCTAEDAGNDVTAEGWTQSSEYTVGTWFGGWEGSGSYGWDATATLNGTATWTITVGGKSETVTQEYHNNYWDARYIELVDPTKADVFAGKVASLEYVVTDRFGNTVEGADVEFSEAGLISFITSTTNPTDTSDENGLVSVDVLTPANNQGDSEVRVHFDGEYSQYADLSDLGVSAGTEEQITPVVWSYKLPTITVKKFFKSMTVILHNVRNNVVRIWVDGKVVKRFVPATSKAISKLKLKPGKHKIVIKAKGVTGLVIKTVKISVKK